MAGRKISARERLTRERLTRERIVAEAIRGGAAGLSMRGLAERLGVTPMALYAHVSDKDDLLDEVLNDALARSARPGPAVAEWRSWMLSFAEQLRAVLIDRPELLERYCRRPVGVTNALDRMEAALAVLAAAGFDDDDAVEVFAAVQSVTVGFTALEAARRGDVAQVPPPRAATAIGVGSPRYWPAFFATLPEARFPNLSRIRPDLATFTSEDRFRRVLAAVLTGFEPSGRDGLTSREEM